jgi:urea transport system permease protein
LVLVRLTALLFLLFSLLIGSGTPGHAAVADHVTQLRALTAAETQRAALEQLRAAADPSLRGVLQALKEGALYTWRDRLLIFTAEGVFVDLAGTKLLDAHGAPLFPEDNLEQVELAEDNIPLVQRILDAINLFATDAALRKSTALRLGNLRDGSLAPLLSRALHQETDAEVRAVLAEALNKLRLSAPEAQVRLQAVEFFRSTRSEAALSRLVELQQQEADPQVQAAVARALQEIEQFLQIRNAVGYAFNGLSLASILLLMSLGLAITFGLMGIINMAHGEMLMLGSYTAYVLQEVFTRHLPGYVDYYFVVALPLSVVVVGCVGWLLERGVLRFLYGRPLESLLITWGIGMILQQGARLYFGDQTSVNSPTWFRGGWEIMPGLILPYSRLFIILLSVCSLLVIYLALFRSRIGLKIRAVMQNRDMAACMGVSARTVDALTFAMGTALAGLAGCALSLIGTVDPEVGKTYIVDSFLVVVLGGVGKLLGTVLAALGIGMSNKLLEPAIGGTAAAVYAKVGILLLVIFFLQLKPTGLFPAKERTAAGALR